MYFWSVLLLLNMQHKKTQFLYQSGLGLLGISYECDYIDKKQNIRMRQNSSTGATNLAMLCERISTNQMLYRCKNPNNSSFDSLVFSVRWELWFGWATRRQGEDRKIKIGGRKTGNGSVSSANDWQSKRASGKFLACPFGFVENSKFGIRF